MIGFKNRIYISAQMASDDDNFMASYRAGIESRVREQLVRHLNVDPTIDRRRVVEIQIGQEREKLERLIEEEDKPAVVSRTWDCGVSSPRSPR
jgi:hypothetical protein